jgi:hypothetical protein
MGGVADAGRGVEARGVRCAQEWDADAGSLKSPGGSPGKPEKTEGQPWRRVQRRTQPGAVVDVSALIGRAGAMRCAA